MTKRRRLFLIIAAVFIVLVGGAAILVATKGGELIYVQEKDAAVFGDNTLNEISTGWSYDRLRFYGASELISGGQDEAYKAMLAPLPKELGYYKSGKGVVRNLRAMKDAVGDDALVGDYYNRAQFEKGEAVVEMSLMKRKVGDWQVMTFNVEPIREEKE